MLVTGIMWLDNTKGRNLSEKVDILVEHFYKKFGYMPNLCDVNPVDYSQAKDQEFKIPVYPNKFILPNTLWVGVNID